MSHHHDHKHSHSHGHAHHAPATFNGIFAIAVILNLTFTITEAFYAFVANSMSLLADAGHNLGDVFGLLMAWGASWLATQSATEKYSYGYKKTTLLAALANSLLLVLASALIIYESINKLLHPVIVREDIVIIVALIGIVINGGAALMFLKGSKEDLNIKAAFLHLAADVLVSFSVVIAGIVLHYTNLVWVDPAVGLVIVFVILLSTWGLLRNSIDLILGAVPHNISAKKVRDYLNDLPGVEAVHDLHIWALSTQEVALTAHLIMPQRFLTDAEYVEINHVMHEDFHIQHVTLQVERGEAENPCRRVTTC